MDDVDAETDDFSETTVRRMVRELRPEWSLREATPADEEREAAAEEHRRAVRDLVD